MADPREFHGKVALITGAGSGIGRATALAFARAGARVAVADVTVAGGEETVRQITAAGGEARFVRCDVSKGAEVERMVAETVAAFGRLDCAFNNAGVEGAQAPTADSTPDNWDRVIGVNLSGVYYCLRAEIPALLRGGGGAIVNCASVAGLVGFAGSAAYTASKHGVLGLTRAAALEYATQGIRVNAVCPGVIQTPMIERFTGNNPQAQAAMVALEPIGRVGRPEEIADAVLWLCSERASFMVGHALAVDGGFVAR